MHAAATTVTPAHNERAREHTFFLLMAIAALLAVLVGFARSFYLRPLFPDWPAAREPFFFLHGTVFTLWFVLLVVQAGLIGAGRVGVHRLLGTFGAVLAVAMVVVGLVGAVFAAQRPTGFFHVPIPPAQFLIVPFFDMLTFITFVAVAIAKRRQAQVHKRMMLLAAISLLTAAFARWPGVVGSGVVVYFLLNDLFLVPLIIWDRRALGRVHTATWLAGGWFVLSQPLRLLLSGTATWLAISRWLTGLV